jgi:hypothetical protein
LKSTALARLSSIALLALALASAQIAGVTHRVEHANLWADAEHADDRVDQSHDGDGHSHDQHPDEQGPEHNCAAYDAATLGDGPPQAISQSQPHRPVHAAPIRCALLVADNSPHLPFHSRAPPRI